MWTLVLEQFRYRRSALLFAAVVALALGLAGALTLAGDDTSYRLWLLILLVVGGTLNIHLWTVEQRERRTLLWSALPVARHQIGGARLLSLFVVQIGMLLICFSGACIASLFGGDAPFHPELVRYLFAGHGFVLLTMTFVYLHEEIMLRTSHWRWGSWGVNLAAIAFFAVATFFAFRYFGGYESWEGVILMHFMSLGFGVCAYVLFPQRKDMLMGVNAFSGCPENWSAGASR